MNSRITPTRNVAGFSLRRRWFRFGLRSFLVFLIALGTIFALLANEVSRAIRQHEAVVSIVSMGGLVTYDEASIKRSDSGVRRWIRDLLHEDCFLRVSEVKFNPMDEELLEMVMLREELKTGRCEFCEETGMDHLMVLTDLRHISFRGTTLSDTGIQRLAALKSLESLTLSETLVTDSGLRHLITLPKLRELNLSGSGISDDGIEFVSQCSMLEELSLGVTFENPGRNRRRIEPISITDEGVNKLAGLRRLRKLDLRGTAITDVGLRDLLDLQKLESLDLIETKVTDVGLAILEDLAALQMLRLVEEIPVLMGPGPTTETLVTEDAVKKLRVKKPRLTVIYFSPRPSLVEIVPTR